MKISKNLKLAGISVLIIVGLAACDKDGATAEKTPPTVHHIATLKGTYRYVDESSMFVEIYYADDAYIDLQYMKKPNGDPTIITVIVGMCQQSDSQIHCRRTGQATVLDALLKGRPNINFEDYKPINVETTDLIKMDADGSFISKRVRTVDKGERIATPSEGKWGTNTRMTPIKNPSQSENELRQGIPAQFFR